MKWHHIEKGQGRPLVLLHGIGMSAEAWTPVFDRLATQRRVIALDIPGFGKTPPLPDWVEPGPEAMLASLAETLAALGLTKPVDMAGNSLGGRIALEAAARGLARSVVGLSPAGLWRQRAPRHVEFLFGAMRQGQQRLPGLAEALLRNPVGRSLLLAGAVSPRAWKMPAEEAVLAARRFAAADHFEHVFDAFSAPFDAAEQVTVPCTIAFGDFDFLLPSVSRDHRRAPAHTHWVRLPACGHVPMWDDPERVSHVILNGTR